MKRNRALKVFGIAAMAAIGVSVAGLVVMGLWNSLMPAIFAVKAISFWQGLGLLVLSRILFGGFRPFGRGPQFRRRMMERWAKMTPEEREKFRRGMRRGCGFDGFEEKVEAKV